MNNNPTLGWDLGGAHLKAVLMQDDGRVLQVFQKPCPLWRGIGFLEQAVAEVMASLEAIPGRHAVTMTGELADIFQNRDTGVQLLAECMMHCLEPVEMHIYAGPSGFVRAEAIHDHLHLIASANWHASAAYLAARVNDGLLVDIGSTTTDIILLHHGLPAARGYTDAERLQREEMVYTGVVRTPVMAVTQRLPFAGEWQRLAAEHFATMADVYRLTEELSEDCDMAETADGAGKTVTDSARRLARMTGRDLESATLSQWRQTAFFVRSKQLHTLQSALERNLSRGLLPDDAPLIGAGAGRFLARELAQLLRRPYVNSADLIDAAGNGSAEWASVCLPAYAVAWLGRGSACR
jgi:probable H4MPT-linked C1 transfer pathway protein